MSKKLRGLFVLIPLLIAASEGIADDSGSRWPQFRGVNSRGVAAGGGEFPQPLDPNGEPHWQRDFPSGHSSPCIWDANLFLTSYEPESKQLTLWCLDLATGQTVWHREITAQQIEKGHKTFSPASSTPTTDGKHVVVYFGSAGLFCFDFEGNELWSHSLPVAKTYAGNGISPIVAHGLAVLYRATYQDHYVIAIDVATGETKWKQELPGNFPPSSSCTGTPIVWQNQVILHSLNGAQAHRLKDGKLIWWVDASTTATSTPVLGNGEVYFAMWNQVGETGQLPETPTFAHLLDQNDADRDGKLTRQEFPKGMAVFHRPEGDDVPDSKMAIRFDSLDRNKNGQVDRSEWEGMLAFSKRHRTERKPHGLMAVRLGGRGDVTASHARLLEQHSIPEVPSPLYYAGKLYMIKNGGILTGIDAANGRRLFRRRAGGRGTYFASPIVSGGQLLTLSGQGDASILDITQDPAKAISRSQFNESVYATPAIAENLLIVRTAEHLYAFELKAN